MNLYKLGSMFEFIRQSDTVPGQGDVHHSNQASVPQCPVFQAVGYETTSIDTIIERCKLDIEKIMEKLVELELNEHICSVNGGYIKV